MKEYKEYVPVSGSEQYTDIEVRLFYDKGGYSYWSNSEVQRGFYASVCPVKRAGMMTSFIAFSGVKTLVKPVGRYSDKAFDEAKEESFDIIGDLLNRMFRKYNVWPIVQEKVVDN